MKQCKLALWLFLTACTGRQGADQKADREVASQILNVYSHRHYDVDKVVFNSFTEETGIKINLVKAGADELISRMEVEKEHSPADVLITVDAMKLNRAKELGLLQPVEAKTNNVPDFIEEAKYWYGITYRARVIVYDKEDVNVADLSTYEDLVNEKWKGKLLIRSSSSSYNQSLLASMIEANGSAQAKDWAKGIVNNLARAPKGGDRDQIKAIVSGVGEIAVVNTYYLGLMLHSENSEERHAGRKVGIYFPNQEGRGAHINVSGIAVAKHAPNKENAIRFIEYLTSKTAQQMYASQSFEYPVNQNVSADSTVAAWGNFKIDALDYAKNTELNKVAVSIFEEVGWH